MNTDHGVSPEPARTTVRRGRLRATRLVATVGLCAAAVLPACDDKPKGERPLGPSRIVEPVGRNIRWNASPAERHGVSAQAFAGGSMGAGGAMGAGSSGLHWTTPPGWKEKPPATFREANFQVGDEPLAECYLTTLVGEAGGLESNINRWRAQMSLPSLSPAEIADLPRVPWLGGQAVSTDFEGRWTGMSGDQGAEGWRLVGLVLVESGRSRFLKMVGPSAVIGSQLEAFHDLAASFHDGAAHGGAAAGGAAPDTMPETMPATMPPAAAATGTMPATDVQQNASLAWTTPKGWQRGPDRPTREVTYFSGPDNAVECYVTMLGGNAGGLLANVNRWCSQLGAAALTDADVAQLEHVVMAGSDAVFVRLQRGEQPGVPEAQEALEGALCMLPDRALFVKLAGPRDAVAGQHGALLEFCRSLRVLR